MCRRRKRNMLLILFSLILSFHEPEGVFGERYISGNNTDEIAATQYLHYHDRLSSEQCNLGVKAEWNYMTDINEENKKKLLELGLRRAQFDKEAWKNITSFAWKTFNDSLVRRWFKLLSILGNAALPDDKLEKLKELVADMKSIYSTSKICPFNSDNGTECNLSLNIEIADILHKSKDYDELLHVWKSWRDQVGRTIKDKYIQFVELSNEAARLNGFDDTGDLWREGYESETFQQDITDLWEQVRPLYEQVHAYVRRKLINIYGSDKIRSDGPIPAHLLGMWAGGWSIIVDDTIPYRGKPSIDVTQNMLDKNMTALDIFKIAEEFFLSLGLKPMTQEFWNNSIFEKPSDREMACHATAWDFCNGRDFRIKQCVTVNMGHFIVAHHEMGHVQYYQHYAHQPSVFRSGANRGFHEAIGDVLALSVSTPKHLKTIGLLDEISEDYEGTINFLYATALKKVVFLPYGYLIDLWRWGVFSGHIKQNELNRKWWEMRLKYQGICPSIRRTEQDFDPGSIYHVSAATPYVRYFVSHVIQFQFHKALCEAAGHTGPLYECDIYNSKDAGRRLSKMLELGRSKHWSEAMNIITGGVTRKMDAGPLLEYFEPLFNWLKEQNKNEVIGWRSCDPMMCP